MINHSEKVYDVYGKGIKIPLIHPNKPGKHVDVTMVVAEGDKYYLRNFNFVGMKLFRTPDLIARQVFRMAPGDAFSTEKLQKGMDELRKLYGNFGYIDFVASPDPEVVPNGKDQIDLTMDVDEGHQFFVRRIDFQGNTTTRDKVIRREMLIDEGDLYSQQLWETSVLRLNQLGYFDPLKARGCGDYHARHQDEYGRSAAEGKGARQKFDSIERRRVGHLGKLHRLFVFHQQFPGTGRDVEPGQRRSARCRTTLRSGSPSRICSTSPFRPALLFSIRASAMTRAGRNRFCWAKTHLRTSIRCPRRAC